ncbi:1-deoxy-D-xylulose-5-phosphate reductoisomerase [Chitinispirillales bacterium ANBcel5]|uniref:1-deoxy-D-xylulose-5-phosphate reductoisomerase n=1 Tax=Cellulosispirillum alkaliphilum TaxID=3039283 RepID=UPI002A50732D|nr:1-deoxy-D-xylulose-5-phosphate reductoisomerase [Chitinispirillales bacterium ANBcel5]
MENLKILVLGSTGSIGKSTCNCVKRFREKFKVAGLAAGSNLELLCKQIEEFSPQAVYIAEPIKASVLREKYGKKLKVYEGAEGLEALVEETEYDILLNALVGAVGFRPTVKALQRNKRVALANKESLVMGGDFINTILKGGKGSLLPVDSEHSAILQCLPNLGGHHPVESMILTASGGPFKNLPIEEFKNISVEQALNHPTWSMGKKITIDSSTMMNKGFEVIEAHHLFSIPYSKLRVCIHPQSIIHSLVEFHDGAVMAQLGLPDMELPIQYALSYPERYPIAGKRLSLPEIGQLEFFEPDLEKFPCLKLCLEAGELGGTAPAIVNAANEVAVELFLAKKIAYTEISQIVAQALRNQEVVAANSIHSIEKADKETRETILSDYLQGCKK